MTFEMTEDFKRNERTNKMTVTTCPSVTETKVTLDEIIRRWRETVMRILKSLGRRVRAVFCRPGGDLSYEEWSRLEYRHELVDRIGERMNHYCIR